jgi:hypothetical protein
VSAQRTVVDQRRPGGVEEVHVDERSHGHSLASCRIDHADRAARDCPNFRGHRRAAMVGENGTVPLIAQIIQQRRRFHAQADDLDAGDRPGPHGLGHQRPERVVRGHFVAVSGDQDGKWSVRHGFFSPMKLVNRSLIFRFQIPGFILGVSRLSEKSRIERLHDATCKSICPDQEMGHFQQ